MTARYGSWLQLMTAATGYGGWISRIVQSACVDQNSMVTGYDRWV